jgi:hypothetical protein
MSSLSDLASQKVNYLYRGTAIAISLKIEFRNLIE